MRVAISRALPFLLGFVALSACGGTSQNALPATVIRGGASWMRPEAAGDLLYIADQNKNEVDVYSYPQGKPAGKLTGFDGLAFLCADRAGNVFIPNYGQHQVLEYAHGGSTPIATLDDSYSTPYSCSVDPATGNLAVANYATTSGAGSVAVYAHAKGKPRIYLGPGKNIFCAYDDKGNLFIEAYASGSQGNYFELEELPKGARIFNNVALDNVPAYPTGLEWNGSYMAIGTGTVKGPSSGDTYIYHVQFDQGVGKTVGSTHLVETGPTTNFFIQGGGVVVTGGNPQTRTKFFRYPRGGSPTKTLTEGAPTGAVISVASKESLGSAGPEYRTIFQFDGTNGSSPSGRLVELNGKLYGTTMKGGTYSHGTVFSITPGGKEAVIHSFGASGDGKDPEAGLTIFRGDLYGTTYGGGPYDFGTVFSVTPEGKERVLHHFGKTPDGQNPTADLVVLNGVLYGTTLSGGEDNGGTVFSITNAGKERVIHRFPYLSKDKGGFAPFGGLIAFNGALYGTTAGGGNCIGTLFKMTTDGREQVLHNFHCSLHDGYDPQADLFEANGVFYGTAMQGGAPFYNNGVVFSLTADRKETVLTYFPSQSDGASPRDTLIGVHGILYGTASEGGDNNTGNVFSLTKSGDEVVLHNFGLPPDGQTPLGGLTNVNGILYGTTSAGGGFTGDGTVYKITLPR